MHSGTDLPAPAPEALAQSERVRALVTARITGEGGFLGFAEYMDAVLYAPGLGYYSAGARKFGCDGDFVTAPELGPAFARCVARLARQALQQLGGGLILEVGGGSGALAADVLLELRDQPPEQYLLLDVSGDLRERQRATIEARVPGLLPRVRWLDEPPSGHWQGVLLANEVLDALPVERFQMREGRPWQLGVRTTAAGFTWAERPAPARLSAAVAELQAQLGAPLPEGYTTEIGLRHRAWLGGLLAGLGRGLALFIDYGGTRREIYHAARRDGTLSCHYRHRQHADPFFLPGLQDLTAWVDFSAAARAAILSGFQVAAYGTQAHALLASGVLDDWQGREGAAEPARSRDLQEIQRLLMPGDMGERFKVLALSRAFAPAFPLTLRDRRESLEGGATAADASGDRDSAPVRSP